MFLFLSSLWCCYSPHRLDVSQLHMSLDPPAICNFLILGTQYKTSLLAVYQSFCIVLNQNSNVAEPITKTMIFKDAKTRELRGCAQLDHNSQFVSFLY